MDGALADWEPTVAAQALVRNNMPLLAYIAGKSASFTSQDHNFQPGEKIEKQLILINNSRENATCECSWSLSVPQPLTGQKKVTIRAGEQERIPLHFELPATLVSRQSSQLPLSGSTTVKPRKIPACPRFAASSLPSACRDSCPFRSERRNE